MIFIARQLSYGSVAVVNVLETTGNDNQIVAALGARLLVRTQTSCEESTSLLWFNPATNAVQMLIRVPAGTQGVVATVTYQPADGRGMVQYLVAATGTAGEQFRVTGQHLT